MTSNHKLSALLAGRTLTNIQHQGSLLTLTYDDGSVMTVKVGGDITGSITNGTVKAVRQQGTLLELVFASGDTMTVVTPEPTSSVMVRDKNHILEYAD